MGGIIGVILGGITLVAAIYVALKYNRAVGTISGGAVSGYTNVAKTFQGS